MEAEERGWDAPDTHVCADCVEDPFLKGLVEAGVEASACDYCGVEADEDLAAPLADIMPAIMGALTHRYAEPGDAGVPYESAEGGYLAPLVNTEEALLSLPLECHDGLFEDIVSSIAGQNDCWVAAADGHWVSVQTNQALRYAWAAFSERVKHRQRYFFTQRDKPSSWDDLPPAHLLRRLGALVTHFDLLRSLATGTPLFRVRARAAGDAWPLDGENLGAPPEGRAVAGRMNPPGISYFYAALEAGTAVAEVVRGPPCGLALGRFQALRPLRVLDLIELPELPSQFDSDRREERELLLFLDDFVGSIAKPVEKDGREHVEYVPSQVVCEYFASVFQQSAPLDGLLYPSAVRPGGKNIVLFPSHAIGRSPFVHVALTEADEVVAENWAELFEQIGG